MLDKVVASRFIRLMEHGRNAPLLLEAERMDGTFVEVVAKLDGAECGSSGLFREAYSAMLAADLGLPVPECFVVEIPPEFIDTIGAEHVAARNVIRKSGPISFGSAFHPGWHLYPADRPLGLSQIEQATEVFAFDGIILNPDRRPAKQNCLFMGDQIRIIDHELALIPDALLGSAFSPYPWTIGGQTGMTAPPGEHLFFKGARKKGGTGARLQAAIISHAAARMAQYLHAIPPEWDADGLLGSQINSYIQLAATNATDSFAETRRVLS